MALDDSDNIRAIMPLFFVKNLIEKKLVSIPYSSHGGILGNVEYIPSLIKNAFELKEKLGCRYIEIRQPPSSNVYKNTLEELGMIKVENRVNHFINPKDKNIEELWMDLSSKNRGAIRKARKNEIIVEKITQEKDIKYVHNLESMTRKHRSLPTANVSYYKNMWRELYPKKYLEILVAKYDNKIIAFAIFFKFKNKVVHAHVGSNNIGKNLGANNLVLWTALENCCEKGCDFFDFGASTLDGDGNVSEHFKGIYSYKCSFNTTNFPYSWYYYPDYKENTDLASEPGRLFKIGGKIFNCLPLPIYKKTGTFFIKKFL